MPEIDEMDNSYCEDYERALEIGNKEVDPFTVNCSQKKICPIIVHKVSISLKS